MEPYYDDGRGIQIFHGDCLEVLPMLSAASIDAVIADPPYGTTACAWDTVIPFAPMWTQIKRLVKPRAAVVLFGSQPFTSALVMSNPGWFKYEWVWEKTVAGDFLNGNNKPLKSHENLVVFSEGTVANLSPNLMTYNPQRDTSRGGWRKVQRSDPRSHTPERGNRTPVELGTVRGNDSYLPRSVIKFANPNHDNDHPTQKPLDLLRYLVLTYTNPGDLVLDFTMGSGTTLVAAKHLGRCAIGIERELKYVEIAIDRLQQEVMQL